MDDHSSARSAEVKRLRNLTAILVAACCVHFAASPASAQQNAPVPIVVVDLSKVFEQHPTFKAEMERIKSEVKTTEASFQATGEKLKQQVQQLQTLKPSSPEFTTLETEISFKQGRIQADMALKRKEFLEREAQVYYSTYMQVQKVVSTFAEANRIGLVLRYSSEKMDPSNRQSVMAGVNQPIVYNQSNLDITRFIVDQLHRTSGGQQTARGNNGQAAR
jgi:Skp family chaperone for outer membrane proteins